MGYKSDTIANVLPRINSSLFLPVLQREFVWTADQICALFDSLMRRYPISSFLFWQVPIEARDDVEAYEFLHTVAGSRNRARLARVHGNRDFTFVLDGQQRLTAVLVGLQGSYYAKKTKSGKGARTDVTRSCSWICFTMEDYLTQKARPTITSSFMTMSRPYLRGIVTGSRSDASCG